jgi:hypothetical protein
MFHVHNEREIFTMLRFPRMCLLNCYSFFRGPKIHYVCNRLRSNYWARITSFGTEENKREIWMREVSSLWHDVKHHNGVSQKRLSWSAHNTQTAAVHSTPLFVMSNGRNAIKIRIEVAEKVNWNAKQGEKTTLRTRVKVGEQKVRE